MYSHHVCVYKKEIFNITSFLFEPPQKKHPQGANNNNAGKASDEEGSDLIPWVRGRRCCAVREHLLPALVR